MPLNVFFARLIFSVSAFNFYVFNYIHFYVYHVAAHTINWTSVSPLKNSIKRTQLEGVPSMLYHRYEVCSLNCCVGKYFVVANL